MAKSRRKRAVCHVPSNVFYGVYSKYKKNGEAERTSYGIGHGVFFLELRKTKLKNAKHSKTPTQKMGVFQCPRRC